MCVYCWFRPPFWYSQNSKGSQKGGTQTVDPDEGESDTEGATSRTSQPKNNLDKPFKNQKAAVANVSSDSEKDNDGTDDDHEMARKSSGTTTGNTLQDKGASLKPKRLSFASPYEREDDFNLEVELVMFKQLEAFLKKEFDGKCTYDDAKRTHLQQYYGTILLSFVAMRSSM